MNFKQAQIEKYLKRPDKAIKCFVIYGSNEGLVSEYVKKLIATVSADIYDPFSVAYLNGSDVNSDSGILFSEYSSQSLMGGRRVVIIKDADNNLTKHLKALFDNSKSDTLVIVYSASLNKSSSLVKLATDDDTFALVACYEDRDEDIFATAKAMFVENGFTISMEALQLLCAKLSNDRKSNVGEIEKLITYMGDRKNITPEQVIKVVSDSSSSNTDDVCFLAASGFTDRALASYVKLVNEGTEPISIIRSMTYHFNKLLTCLSYMEQGETLDKVMYKLTPRIIFFRETSFKKQVSIWNRDKILSVLDLLYKCERDCKTTYMPVAEVASYCIMQISSAAKKLI